MWQINPASQSQLNSQKQWWRLVELKTQCHGMLIFHSHRNWWVTKRKQSWYFTDLALTVPSQWGDPFVPFHCSSRAKAALTIIWEVKRKAPSVGDWSIELYEKSCRNNNKKAHHCQAKVSNLFSAMEACKFTAFQQASVTYFSSLLLLWVLELQTSLSFLVPLLIFPKPVSFGTHVSAYCLYQIVAWLRMKKKIFLWIS